MALVSSIELLILLAIVVLVLDRARQRQRPCRCTGWRRLRRSCSSSAGAGRRLRYRNGAACEQYRAADRLPDRSPTTLPSAGPRRGHPRHVRPADPRSARRTASGHLGEGRRVPDGPDAADAGASRLAGAIADGRRRPWLLAGGGRRSCCLIGLVGSSLRARARSRVPAARSVMPSSRASRRTPIDGATIPTAAAEEPIDELWDRLNRAAASSSRTTPNEPAERTAADAAAASAARRTPPTAPHRNDDRQRRQAATIAADAIEASDRRGASDDRRDRGRRARRPPTTRRSRRRTPKSRLQLIAIAPTPPTAAEPTPPAASPTGSSRRPSSPAPCSESSSQAGPYATLNECHARAPRRNARRSSAQRIRRSGQRMRRAAHVYVPAPGMDATRQRVTSIRELLTDQYVETDRLRRSAPMKTAWALLEFDQTRRRATARSLAKLRPPRRHRHHGRRLGPGAGGAGAGVRAAQGRHLDAGVLHEAVVSRRAGGDNRGCHAPRLLRKS